MIRHIFRMVWNRKKSNLLIWLELLVSFLVVYAVCAFLVFFVHNARQPLGYDIADVWELYVGPPRLESDEDPEARARKESDIVAMLRAHDAVLSAAVVTPPPYKGWTNRRSWTGEDGRTHVTEVIDVSQGFPETLGFRVLDGRFFLEGDEALAYRPVLVNRRLAREVFGDGEVLGQILRDLDEDSPPGAKPDRVVGVFEDYRKAGEFSKPKNTMMQYVPLGKHRHGINFVVMKMAPGTPAEVEQTLLEQAQAMALSWSFQLTRLEDAAANYRRQRLQILLVAGLVAGFLLLMVALGLLGVLWQSITQRMQEIGVRRAKGAAARQIYTQVLGELLGVTALALLVGTLLLVQLPLTGWLEALTPAVTFPAYALAVLIMLGLTLLSGLYPSRLASRIRPAEALHYE